MCFLSIIKNGKLWDEELEAPKVTTMIEVTVTREKDRLVPKMKEVKKEKININFPISIERAKSNDMESMKN